VAGVVDALRMRRYGDALQQCAQLLKTDPESPKLWTLRGVALENTDRASEALESYKKALKIAPDYVPALEAAAQLEYKAQSDNALPLLRRIVQIQPENPTAHAMLGVVEHRMQQYAECAQDFEHAGDLTHSQPGALMANALCLAHLNRAPEAVPLLKQLVEMRPSDAAARYNLALLQWRSGAGDDALATLEPSIHEGRDSAALRLAARLHEAKGETPAAVELLRAAMMADPEDADNYLEFAAVSFAHGSYSVGIDMINVGLSRLPNSAPLYMARGVLNGQSGDFDKAMADFEHAHTLDPSNSMTASAEGIAQSQRHNHEEALALFRKQVSEHPFDAFGYYLLAEALSWSGPDAVDKDNQGEIKEAIAAAKRAQELDPKLLQTYDLLSSLYLQNGEVDSAISQCRTALKIKDNDQQAIYTLMLALRKTGANQEARQMVERLTRARKEEQQERTANARYGALVEQP